MSDQETLPHCELEIKIRECYDIAIHHLKRAEEYFKVSDALEFESYKFRSTIPYDILVECVNRGNLDGARWENGPIEEQELKGLKEQLLEEFIVGSISKGTRDQYLSMLDARSASASVTNEI